jgi:transposase
MARKPHPALGFRACLGILRLQKRYGGVRLEAACTRALKFGGASYHSVAHILARGLDREPLGTPAPPLEPLLHENLRGPAYFTD